MAQGLTRTEWAMALLERLDPIVECYVETGSACGDPLGFEYTAKPYRLSALLALEGWSKARGNPEVSHLLATLLVGDLP